MPDHAHTADELTAGSWAGADDAVLVEVTRGGMVESRHRGVAAVVDARGRVAGAWGDIERPVYARSALKPIQALTMVETGAAEAFDVSDREIALACASHGGEPEHVEVVTGWLQRIGCSVGDLECGGHLPSYGPAAEALLRADRPVTAAHNNCSGKHAGFLTAVRHLGKPTAGYIRFEHPVQQRNLGVLEQLTGLDLSAAPRGIDGCGIPVIGVPLGNLALAMARYGDPHELPDHRAAAASRIRKAMAAHPFMVAGTGRFCTAVLETLGETICIKTGAEGVFMAALPELGLGLALKVSDGAGRGAEVATLRLLEHLAVLSDEQRQRLESFRVAPVLNRAGRIVGEIRPAADCPF